MTATRTPNPEEGRSILKLLLKHEAWVRTLARSLVPDSATAEDLAQETLARAIRKLSPDIRNPRAWLGAVATNLARNLRRDKSRRLRHEKALAEPREEPSAAELFEKETDRYRIAETLADLEQPYRQVLLLTFFDKLPQAEIGKRLGVSVPTVKRRLRRGLVLLRRKLDGEFGDRKKWVPALLVWAGLRPAESAPLAEATASARASRESSRIRRFVPRPWPSALAGGAAALALVAWTAAERGASSDEPTFAVGSAEKPGERIHLSVKRPSIVGFGARQGLPADRSTGQPIAAPPNFLAGSGLVLDPTGRPVPGVRLGLFANKLAKALLDAEAPVDLAAQPWLNLGLAGKPFEAVSGPEGAIELPQERGLGRVGWGLGDHDVVGYGTSSLEGENRFLVVVAPKRRVRVQVLDERGQPVVGAEVSTLAGPELLKGLPHVLTATAHHPAPDWRATTDAKGFCTVGVPRIGGARLRVLKEGYRGAVSAPLPTDRTEDLVVLGGFSPGELALEGGREAGYELSICGIVLDPRGQPVGGLFVDLADPTPLEPVQLRLREPQNLEELASFRRRGHREYLAMGSAEPVRTDSEGRFCFGGLSPRPYRLLVWDGKGRAFLRTETVEAGTSNLALSFPELRTRSLRGRVLSPAGEPLEGVRVSYDLGRPDERPAVRRKGFFDRAPVVSDAAGRFFLEGIPAGDVFLVFRPGPGVRVMETFHSFPSEQTGNDASPASHDFTVRRSVFFQVRLRDPREADALALLDERGNPLGVLVTQRESARPLEQVVLEEGESPVCAAGEPKTVVLYRSEGEGSLREVRRVAVEIPPGNGVTVLWL